MKYFYMETGLCLGNPLKFKEISGFKYIPYLKTLDLLWKSIKSTVLKTSVFSNLSHFTQHLHFNQDINFKTCSYSTS